MWATTPSPCSVAKPAEVRAAFDGTVGAGVVDHSLPLQPTCRFLIKGSTFGARGGVAVSFALGESVTSFKVARNEIKGSSVIRGVGDYAFYDPGTTTVELLKGKTVAEVQGIFPGANAVKLKAALTALARAVAKHM